MNNGMIYSILEIFFFLTAIVLIFIGLRTSIKCLDKESKSKQVPKTVFIQSTKVIIIGILFYGIARYASNSLSTEAQGYRFIDMMIQSLWEAVYTIGFVALIPYVIFRIASPKNKNNDS